LVQSVKQGFCFSWGSTWQLQFAQEENSQKPEPQLKQPRSSTKETDRTAQTLHNPCRTSSKLGFQFQTNIPPGPTSGIKQKPSLEEMQPDPDQSPDPAQALF